MGCDSGTNSAMGAISLSSGGLMKLAMEKRSSEFNKARCSGDLYNPFVKIWSQRESGSGFAMRAKCVHPDVQEIQSSHTSIWSPKLIAYASGIGSTANHSPSFLNCNPARSCIKMVRAEKSECFWIPSVGVDPGEGV
jgi:hypothetical protein